MGDKAFKLSSYGLMRSEPFRFLRCQLWQLELLVANDPTCHRLIIRDCMSGEKMRASKDKIGHVRQFVFFQREHELSNQMIHFQSKYSSPDTLLRFLRLKFSCK